jgi:hypothetical protein
LQTTNNKQQTTDCIAIATSAVDSKEIVGSTIHHHVHAQEISKEEARSTGTNGGSKTGNT